MASPRARARPDAGQHDWPDLADPVGHAGRGRTRPPLHYGSPARLPLRLKLPRVLVSRVPRLVRPATRLRARLGHIATRLSAWLGHVATRLSAWLGHVATRLSAWLEHVALALSAWLGHIA